MGATVHHELTATTPDNPAAEIRPTHWNSAHIVAVSLLSAAEIFGAFSNANGFEFQVSADKVVGSYTQSTHAHPYAGTGATTATTAGTEVKATNNSAGLSLAVPAYITTYAAQTVQTQASGNIPRSGFTTTTVAGTAVAGTHNTDGLLVAIPPYITTYAAQSVQTQPSGAIAGTGLTTTTTAGTEVKGTLGTNGLSLAVPAYLTAAVGGGGAGTGATTATTAGTQIKATLGTDGLSLAYPAALTTAQPVGAYLTTARGSTDAVGLNTALTANGVAWTVNSSGLSLNVPAFLTTARGSTDAVGLNTALTANGVAWTVNSSGLSLNVPAFLTTAALSNHSHGNPTLALTNLSGTTASASNGFTLSLAAAAPGGGATVSVMEIMDGARLTTAAQWNNATYSRRPIFVPFDVDVAMTGCHTIRFLASRSTGTVLVATMYAGVYSRPTATSASLISSTSLNISVSTSAQYAGVRMYDITGLNGLSLPAGRYLLALNASMAATDSLPLHLMGGDAIPSLSGFVLSGTNQTAATATNSHVIPMWGVYSATSAGLPANVAASEISGGGSQNSPDVYAIIKAI
jgi:hypothetical protein